MLMSLFLLFSLGFHGFLGWSTSGSNGSQDRLDESFVRFFRDGEARNLFNRPGTILRFEVAILNLWLKQRSRLRSLKVLCAVDALARKLASVYVSAPCQIRVYGQRLAQALVVFHRTYKSTSFHYLLIATTKVVNSWCRLTRLRYCLKFLGFFSMSFIIDVDQRSLLAVENTSFAKVL